MSQPNIAPDGNGNITPSYQDSPDPDKWNYGPGEPPTNNYGPFYTTFAAPIDWDVEVVPSPPPSEVASGLSATATFLQRFGFGNYNPPPE